MSMSKRKVPANPPTDKSDRKLTDVQESTTAMKTIGDIPLEVLTMILEFLVEDVAANRKNVVGYRQVNSQWKGVIDPLIEKKILSGNCPPFPEMKIVSGTNIRFSSKRFPDGSNPFPFNSLLITGNGNAVVPKLRHIRTMGLGTFLSQFGGDLTTFALHNQLFTIQLLAGLLGSLRSLKSLILKDVTHVDAAKLRNTLPIAPQLSSLAALELTSSPFGTNVLYVWLIVSYGEQLARLNLQTEVPPLQKRHRYSDRLPRGQTFSIATTSDAAFGQLKELKITSPSREFLKFSDIVALKHLSIAGFGFGNLVPLRELLTFVSKSGNTLQIFDLDVQWPVIVASYSLEERTSDPVKIVTFPVMKNLAVHFPWAEREEDILSNVFLAKFPDLETLSFSHFRSKPQKVKVVGVEDDNSSNEQSTTDSDIDEFIAGLEPFDDASASMKVRLEDERRDKFVKRERMRRARLERLEEHQRQAEVRDAWNAASQDELASQTKLAEAVKEYDGRKTEKELAVRQLLERQSLWNLCPKLRNVSVSSSEKTGGNTCWTRREDL